MKRGFSFFYIYIFIYINNISEIISDKFNPVLYVDDSSIIITNSDPLAFRHTINEVVKNIN